MSKLLPCPFCGSTDIEIQENGYGSFWVICNECYVTTGEQDIASRAEARERWNKRTAVTVKESP